MRHVLEMPTQYVVGNFAVTIEGEVNGKDMKIITSAHTLTIDTEEEYWQDEIKPEMVLGTTNKINKTRVTFDVVQHDGLGMKIEFKDKQ